MEITKKPLSKLKKEELLEVAKFTQNSLEKCKNRLERETAKSTDLQQQLTTLQTENATLKRTLREGNGITSTDFTVQAVELTDLLEKHRALEKQYGELLSNHNKIKKRLDESHEHFDSLKQEFNRLLEVKKSLVDNDQAEYMLVDHRYFIRFISRDAPTLLKSRNLFDFMDQKVFKLFDFSNGMLVKKHIDKVLVEHRQRSLKDAVCKFCDDKTVEFRSELYATRFRDKPAVLFTFK